MSVPEFDAETYLPIGAAADVTYRGARKASDGTYLNAGTCTWRLLDSAGAIVDPAATGTLAYVAASSGNYAGTIPAAYTAGLTAGAVYQVEISFAELLFEDKQTLIRIARKRQGR